MATDHWFPFEDNISFILRQWGLPAELKDGSTWLRWKLIRALYLTNHVIGPGMSIGQKMSQLNIFPGLASALAKERACLSEISGAVKQESLGLLVTVFAATCRVPAGSEASPEDRKVKTPSECVYRSSLVESYLHSAWTFHLYVFINSLFLLFFTLSFCPLPPRILLMETFISWTLRTIRYTCPNLISTVAPNLSISSYECSGSSKLWGLGMETLGGNSEIAGCMEGWAEGDSCQILSRH